MSRPKTSSLIKCALLFVLLCAITVFVMHRQFDFDDVISSFRAAGELWLLPAAAAIAMFFVCEGINIGRCLRISGVHTTMTDRLMYSLTGFFFSSITPSASGGQPMQLYLMHKNGISIAHGSLALLTELMSFQAAASLLALAGVAAGALSSQKSASVTALMAAGIGINTVILIFIGFIVLSPSAVRNIAAPAASALAGLFPSRSSQLKMKFFRGLSEYRRASAVIRRHPYELLKMFLTSCIQLICYFSITWFVCKSLGNTDADWTKLTLMNAALFSSVSAWPLPGAVGVIEGGFSLLFENTISPQLMGSVLILVRMINFGLPLLISGISLLRFMPYRYGHNKQPSA